jgi:hypothetical protein
MNNMKSIKNLAPLPGAWICNPKDKGRKSIKRDNNIYLKDNEEFLIELFNPLKDSVLADIKLNGKSISESGLIIKPGQRVYLDCFIDDGKKFIFQTYDVDGGVVKESIKNNGDVQIFFYKESFSSFRNWTYYPYLSGYKPWGYPTYPTNPFWYGTTTSTTIIGDSNLDGGILRSNSNSYNVSYDSCITTGRVEKGDKSNMKFEDDYNYIFEKNHIHSVSYKLLPDVMEPVEVKKPKKIGNVIELIRGLGELYESGVLTKDEFETKKSELLSRI